MKGTPARLAALVARLSLALALAAPALAPALAAQETPANPTGLPLAEGTKVRIRAGSIAFNRRIEGSVMQLLVDTVVVDTAPEWRTHRFFGGSTIPLDSLRRVPVPVDSIRELQISTGRSRVQGATRWVIRGAIFGALIGGLANTPQRNPSLRDVGEGALVGLPVGASLGLIYGLFNPGEVWRSVPLPGRSR